MASPDAAPQVPTSTLFDSLLEQSRKLRKDIDVAELPPIQLGLGEIERRAKELKRAAPGKDTKSKAHYLFQAGGINDDETLRDLDQIDFSVANEPSAPAVDTDLESYLRRRKEQNILSSIEDGMKRTTRDFDSFVAKNVTSEWDTQKKRVFEHFGLLQKPEGAVEKRPDQSTFGASRLGATAFGKTRPGLRSEFGTASAWGKSSFGVSTNKGFAEPEPKSLFGDVDPSKALEVSRQVQARKSKFVPIVKELNATRLAGKPYPLLKKFEQVTTESGSDELTLQFVDAWRILQSIVGQPNEDGEIVEPKERAFASLYIRATESPNGEDALRLRKMIENGARRHLERQYREVMDETVRKNPLIAKMGGIPSTINKFKAYTRVQESVHPEWKDENLDIIEGLPVWVFIFYLLRAGCVHEILAYVKENLQAIQKIDRNFHHYIGSYCSNPDRKLSRQMVERMQSEFQQRNTDNSKQDKFRIAVYKIIGRIELNKRSLPDVCPTAEDWLWLQLVLTREVKRGDEPAQQVFTLLDFQKSILAYGAKHFMSKTSNIGLYFQMLLCCGLFEQAVQYLYNFQPVDSTHFAIGLVYYGLLGIAPTSSDSPDAELLKTGPKGQQEINFARMIETYTVDFRNLGAEDAVDYLTLICLNSDVPNGPAQLKLSHEALRVLVLESRQFTNLLGDVKADGTRERGAIEKRMKLIKLDDQKEFLRTITEQAALQADEDGRTTDAVLLYHLAEDYDTVIQIVNKYLSDWIANEDLPLGLTGSAQLKLPPSVSVTESEDAPQLARNMTAMYSGSATMYSQISIRNQEICGVLLKLSDAKKLFMGGKFDACLKAIDEVNIIPLENEVDMGAVRRKAQNFSALHETVARNVAILLKMSVECCWRIANEIKSSQFTDPIRERRLQELRNKTKCVGLYAGMIQFKLPAQVYEFIASRDEGM